MQWMSRLAEGAAAAFRGSAEFYGERKLWKYAIFPLAVTAAFYLLLGWGAHCAGRHLADSLAALCDGLPEFLRWLGSVLRFTVMLTTFLVFGLVIAFTLSTLYELFGWLFFDRMIEEFELGHFGRRLPPKNAAFTMQFFRDSCFYSLGTLFYLLLTALAGLFFPLLGQLAAVVIAGYRIGVVYVAAAGYNDGRNMTELRLWAMRHKLATAGFGITVYLLMLIPFAPVFLLPGLVLGGVLLYRADAPQG